MARINVRRLRPDSTRRSTENLISRLCLVLVGAIAATVLLAWMVPGLARMLPAGWTIMKANTALIVLLNTASLAFSESRSARREGVGTLLAAAAALLTGTVLIEYVFRISTGIDTLLAADRLSATPGRMSPQTAVSFTILSLLIATTPLRVRRASWISDLGALALCYLVLMIASGYLFGALHLFGLSMGNRVSLQTLACLTLLTYVLILRAARSGLFSILLDSGIAGHLARTASPVVLSLPFILEVGRVNLRLGGIVSPQYAAALATSLTAVLALGFVLFMARRIDGLEQEIQALSFRDDLTGLQNRKGFLIAAERALSAARNALLPFTVLFIDLDNLKTINDTMGHDAGSLALKRFGGLLAAAFRQGDVLGRIGGDEFVVAGEFTEEEILAAAERLERTATELDFDLNLTYPLAFSFGYATSVLESTESLEQHLGRADLAMYAAKRSKKISRQAVGVER
jgi:diguanylate cyclase (GGDEF)-like protein